MIKSISEVLEKIENKAKLHKSYKGGDQLGSINRDWCLHQGWTSVNLRLMYK